MKLTGPQMTLLRSIYDRPTTCSDTYKPALKLVSLGYADWKEGKFSDVLQITEAGRAALTHSEPH